MKIKHRFRTVLLFVVCCSIVNISLMALTVEVGSILQQPQIKELVFKTVGELPLRIFYSSPEKLKQGDKRTAVVFIHGGGWVNGGTDVFFMHARYFALRGAVGFSIEYRLLKPNGPYVADCLADCKSAIRYLRAHAKELGIDPNKIVVIGDSAGGHLTDCLGTRKYPSRLYSFQLYC